MQENGMTAPDRRPERTVDLSLYLLRAIVPEGLGPDRAADIMDRDIDAPMPLDHIPVKRTGAVSFLKVVNFTISVEPVGTKARNGRHRGVLGAVSDGHCRAFPGLSGRNRPPDALGSARNTGQFIR